MEKILIINDRQDLADRIIRYVTESGFMPVTVLGDNSRVLLPKVKALLRKQSKANQDVANFKGTILDILFQTEPDGGIKLWEALTNQQRRRAGKLMVVTNEDNPDVQQFCASFAEGRCFAFTNPRLRSLIKTHLS